MRHWITFGFGCLLACQALQPSAARAQAAPLATLLATGASTIVQFGADPTAAKDSTVAWNEACAAIPPGGQGRIELPPGDYKADAPWKCDGRALHVAGSAEGITRIRATHGGTVLSFAPGDLQRRLTIERLSVVPAAPCMTDTGIAVQYPPSLSHLLRTLTIRDVEIVSATTPATGCYPHSIRRGLSLEGVWNGLIERMSINGPYALPPVPGTVGVEIGQYGVSIHVNELTAYTMEVGIDIAGYVEGIFLQTPTLVAVGTGFRVGREGAGRHPQTGESALSLVFKGGECAIFHRCIDWTDVTTGQVYANRMAQQPDGPAADRFISLQNSKLVLVHDNAFLGDPRHVTTAVEARGDRSTLNRLDANQCLNLVRCVVLGEGTTHSTVLGNQQNVATPDGFSDRGTGNVVVSIPTPARP